MKPTLTLLTALLLAPLAALHAADDSALTKPNIIYILVDDLGYGDLSCYPNHAGAGTPNIDCLAASGVRMMQAYASPVCSPTRTALLTGRFAERSGVYGNHDGGIPGLGPQRASFVPRLQQAGYRTAWFGKWHQGWDVANHPANNGFDITFGFLGGMHDYFSPCVGDHHIGGPYAPHAYVFAGFRPVMQMDYLTDELTRRAIAFIGQQQSGPFFIYLAYSAPHSPMQAPDEIIRKHLPSGVDPKEAVRRAMIEVLDTNVGRLMAALNKNGLEKNTLVIFQSDNGAESERHNGGLHGTKMTAWEGGIRVPLIASWPGTIPAGRTSQAMCALPDMAATFLHLAGADAASAACDGVDLLPFFTGQRAGNAHHDLVWGPPGTKPTPDNVELLAIRQGPWKLVRDTKRKIDALYNLTDDLAESKDLSAEQPQQKAKMLAYAADYLKTCPPSCGRLAIRDTRETGDIKAMEELRAHCQELLDDEGAAKPAKPRPGRTTTDRSTNKQ